MKDKTKIKNKFVMVNFTETDYNNIVENAKNNNKKMSAYCRDKILHSCIDRC